MRAAARAVPLPEFQWPSPAALVVGNEATGINEKVLALCDHVVRVPMHGYKNTINVASVFSVLLYDFRNRCAPGPPLA